jgi:N-methylhydantoinase B/oxoprolinase/acetone carboxylase alpha subunit
VVNFQTPGGGGLFDPAERDPSLTEADLRSGLATSEIPTRETKT